MKTKLQCLYLFSTALHVAKVLIFFCVCANEMYWPIWDMARTCINYWNLQRVITLDPFPKEHIVKNGHFHWKASSYKFKLLWNYEKSFNTNQTWHKCWLDHCLCNDMVSLKFPVTTATRGHLKIAKNHYFASIFSIKIYFKVLQLLNGLR
jgi:hypothetical protein